MVRGELPSLTSCVLGPLTFRIVGIYSPSAVGSQDVPSILSPVVEKLTAKLTCLMYMYHTKAGQGQGQDRA